MLNVKAKVWIEGQDLSWTEGLILDIMNDGRKILVSTVNGNIVCDHEKVFLRNDENSELADNLKDLVYLDEPNVSNPNNSKL